ncbi:glycosyltransferase [Helicobacter sp.]|uniref:glycosyltransferase n=1 Tax=Helicobacter sp. TaxID=218 RepID=UPI002A766A66|nr:glycosyltransferase [Helicobacter sp.]MDY2584240.1 glycosyltransferase [Helicobacter sp.]
MRKIAFVIDVMRKGGGAQKVLPMLLKTLGQSGIQTKLIVLKKTQDLVDLTGLEVEFILSDEGCKLSENAFLIIDRIMQGARECDLLVSFMDFITSYFVALSAKMLNKPYDIFVRCEPSFVAATFPQAEVNKGLYRMCFMGARAVVCNSKSSCLDVINHFKIPKDKVFLLYNPINTRQILEQSNASLGEMESLFCGDDVVCVAVGRLHAQKNYKTLLKAFLELKDSKIKLMILGEGEQRGELEGFIRSHKMENVLLLGYQSNIYPFLKRADICVHSSFYEGFPNGVLEAACLKKPLILSDISTHREVFGNGGAEFFMPEDFKGLAGLIMRIASNTMERTRLSKGAECVMRAYQNESFENRLEKLLLGKPS